MCTFDKTKPRPAWLDGEHENKNTRRSQAYYRRLWDAQPPWSNRKAIRAIYREAAWMRRNGFDVVVDHVIPLNHPLICGLHVPANLAIIPRDRNAYKSNRDHPAHPQADLFERTHASEFFELEVVQL